MVSDTNTSNNVYRVVIPAGIDPQRGIAGAKLCCLLQHLLTLTCLTDERRYRGYWINVHCEKWRSLLGSYDYRKTIDAAHDAGFIEVNETYCDGSNASPFTKSTRLAKRYRSGKAQIVTITNKPAVQRLSKSWEPAPDNLGPTGLWWFNKLSEFRIDPAAIHDPALGEPWTQLVLAKLLDRRIVATRCDFRRLHTLLTQTARDARRYLRTTQNEPVAIVDVSACQPLIIGLLASHPPDTPTQPRVGALLPNVARFRGSADIEKWIRLCESRGIYSYLWQAVQDYPGSTITTVTTRFGRRVRVDLRGVSLKSFKRSSLIPLFDRLPEMERNPVFKIIARDFPSIAKFCIEAKSKSYRVGHRTIKHQVLACMAQRFEAETIVDDVGAYLMRHHADEPVATIHDAILCRQSFALTAQQIIQDEFGKFGVRPKVQIENL